MAMVGKGLEIRGEAGWEGDRSCGACKIFGFYSQWEWATTGELSKEMRASALGFNRFTLAILLTTEEEGWGCRGNPSERCGWLGSWWWWEKWIEWWVCSGGGAERNCGLMRCARWGKKRSLRRTAIFGLGNGKNGIVVPWEGEGFGGREVVSVVQTDVHFHEVWVTC